MAHKETDIKGRSHLDSVDEVALDEFLYDAEAFMNRTSIIGFDPEVQAREGLQRLTLARLYSLELDNKEATQIEIERIARKGYSGTRGLVRSLKIKAVNALSTLDSRDGAWYNNAFTAMEMIGSYAQNHGFKIEE